MPFGWLPFLDAYPSLVFSAERRVAALPKKHGHNFEVSFFIASILFPLIFDNNLQFVNSHAIFHVGSNTKFALWLASPQAAGPGGQPGVGRLQDVVL
jgi:hypothetical protein